jgi:hypothetical protein
MEAGIPGGFLLSYYSLIPKLPKRRAIRYVQDAF